MKTNKTDLNRWQEKADTYRNHLKQLDEWTKSNWSQLPEGVKYIIARGGNEYRDSIRKYEEWAKRDILG